jgi:acetyl esterase/lipase
MVSRTAKLHRPVVKLIGRRLAAVSTPEAMRRVIGISTGALAPCLGVRHEPAGYGDDLDGLRTMPKSGADSDRAVLFFHGGGYVFGSARMYRHLVGRIAKAAGVPVYQPDYRLAPEHPHPAAVDDGLDAYRAMLDRVAPERLVVGGDSAGGNLTVAVLQRARSEGLPMPAGTFLLSPWLDLRGVPAERANVDTELLILPASVDRATAFYVGDRDVGDPAVSPILGPMEGLPPTLVQVASNELLYDDSAAFADVAAAAGVEVTLEVEDGLWHVWQLMAPVLPEARASIASIARFVTDRTT